MALCTDRAWWGERDRRSSEVGLAQKSRNWPLSSLRGRGGEKKRKGFARKCGEGEEREGAYT